MSEFLEHPDQSSDDFTEIISNTPNWFLRWGISCMFIVFLFVFALSCFIRYPYTVGAKFKLISDKSPQIITAHGSGRLRGLTILDGATVKDNQIIGYLESTANADDISILNKNLQKLLSDIYSNRTDLLTESAFGKNNKLGELQKSYETFHKYLNDYNSTFNTGYYKQQQAVIMSEISQLQKMNFNMRDQMALKERDMNISKERLSIQRKLLEKKIISVSELRNEESSYITKSMPYKEASSSLISLDLTVLSKKKELLEIEQTIKSSRENLLQSTKSLLSEIEKWSEEYIIRSEGAGIIVFINPLQNGQYIKQNTDLFYIVTSNDRFVGELMVDQKELGKIKLNQKVHIKFEGYPYQEYGYVIGKISTISNVPLKDNLYRSIVSLPSEFRSNYGKQLTPRWGMLGNAEIMTDDTSVFYRLLSGIIPK